MTDVTAVAFSDSRGRCAVGGQHCRQGEADQQLAEGMCCISHSRVVYNAIKMLSSKAISMIGSKDITTTAVRAHVLARRAYDLHNVYEVYDNQ